MEGMDIPIGGDMTALNEAFERIIAAMDRLGASISASFEKANASISGSVAKMATLQSGISATAAAQERAAAAANSTGAKLMNAARAAGGMAQAIGHLGATLGHVSSIMQVLGSNNFGTMLTNLTRIGSGLKNAMKSVWSALQQLGTSNSFWKIAAGAAAGVAGVLLLRTAFRTVTGSIRLLGNSVSSVFRGMVNAARSTASAIGNAFRNVGSMPGRMFGGALPIAGLVGGLGGLAAAVGFGVKSIQKAANMETLETAFAPLLGGAAAAQARIAELAQFAATTPFELPEVATGSRVLETLTRGALATGKGLRLVGDVAAGTGKPFEELAMWIGRLYDGLQSGRPVGEALMRLQELGVVSGDVRGRIEALQKSGAAGAEIWNTAAAALGRFSGSMVRQSQTWNGKLSTFRDAISMTMAEFGKPIIDGLKPFLDLATTRIESFKATAQKVGDAIRTVFDYAFAIYNSGKIAEILGAETKLAFVNGVNVLFAGLSNAMDFLSSSLIGIQKAFVDGFKDSGIADIFKFLSSALGNSIAAAINDALGNIPGLGDLKKQAEHNRQMADVGYSTVGELLPYLDLGAGLRSFSATLEAEMQAVRDSFQRSLSDPLIDTTKLKAEADALRKEMSEIIQKNRASMEASAKKLDADLKSQQDQIPSTEGLQSSVQRATAPAVMSLTRVGGGGGPSMMGNLFSEARRQSGYLRELVKQGSTTKPITARYS